LALVPCFAFLGSGCGGGAKAGQPPVTSKQVVAAVTSFDPANLAASIGRLDDASFGDASLATSLKPYLRATDAGKRWAAVYLAAILIDTKTAALLKPALRDRDPANRALAAGALARTGAVDALPVLIEALGSKAMLPYNDPPKPVASFARGALAATTGKAFSTATEWRTWWAKSKGTIRWNGERFVAS